MRDDEFKAKIEAYFERLGVDVKELQNCRVVLEIDGGEIIGHIFLHDDDEIPPHEERIGPPTKKFIH